ncbi:insulin receptor substrate 1 isoform X2 [Strongylocentrotus purpuratus]|uniref:Insulin receptor substrate 1 n=1 Tax=Strongylocentrotus purpuratus TaxID=7668 RepID=A0A7M7N3S4_STRPU|nr:insulin receptor substrate 1 isoform X2 [Strongylocentrotus purpuratus]
MSSQKENVPIPCGVELSIGDIEKSGYLRKLKTMRKKYFVLRSESITGPSRLEYYDNEKKFRLGGEAKRTVPLSACFNINKKSDAKHKHAIALYTRDDCFSLVADDEESKQEWLRVLLEQQRAGGDGKPVPAFEHVWQVTVKPKGLGSSRQLSGIYRLCLTTSTISLVRMNSENEGLEFSLSAIRRCGHSDCFFFMEVGRQSVTGPGELWMQVEDTVIAQSIHEASLEAMRSVKQQEEMRPRSHSSTMSSGNPGSDSKSHSASGSRRQSNTLGPSWRTRCDSMPVPNRAMPGSRSGSRSRGNSEGEDGQSKEEHAIASSSSPVSSLVTHLKWCSNYIGTYFGLLKFGNKLRPRTSSEGEKGMKAPDSPTKTRGRFSIPSLTSRSSLSSGPIRPLSVHRMVAQPMSNSPPIPNSPLSESPQSYLDERYQSEGHSSDDHYFTRFGSSGGRSRTPDSPSHVSIREESQEANDEYMSMSPSAASKALPVPRNLAHSPHLHHHRLSPSQANRRASSPAISSPSSSPSLAPGIGGPHLQVPVPHHYHHHHHHHQQHQQHQHQHVYQNHQFLHVASSSSCASSAESSPRSLSPLVVDEPDSYMAMTPSNRSRPSSVNLAPSSSPASHITPSPSQRLAPSSGSGLKAPSNEDEGYMMMGPSPGSKRATPITITPQAGSTSAEPSTYMLMNPSANRPSPSSCNSPSLAWAPAPMSISPIGGGGGGAFTTNSLGKSPDKKHRNSAGQEDASLLKVGSSSHQRSHSEPVVDTYCNMEFEAKGSQVSHKACENNNINKKDVTQRHSMPPMEPKYINVNYEEKNEQLESSVQVTVDAPDCIEGNAMVRNIVESANKGLDVVKNGSPESGVNGEYMNMSFGKGRNGPKGITDLSKRQVPPLLLDPMTHPDSHDYINVQTDIREGVVKSSPRHSPVSPPSPSWLQRPVAEQLLRKSLEDLSFSQLSNSIPSRGSANSLTGVGSNRNSDTMSPGALSSHHSSRRSSQSSLSGERELNYIDVDIGQPASEKSGSSTPTLREKRSRSPFRRIPNEDKNCDQVNYSTIDFTKSEGLRSVTSTLRDARY